MNSLLHPGDYENSYNFIPAGVCITGNVCFPQLPLLSRQRAFQWTRDAEKNYAYENIKFLFLFLF